jgi:DNA-binding response OmpR family regulator
MRKILLVDDDPITLEAYRRKLLQSGLEVELARDGIVALQVLHSARPDLVVLDLMMPKFNGFEILKYVRAQDELKNMGVVVLSNFYSDDPEHQAAMAAADVTLTKSHCTPALLLETINHILDHGPPTDLAPSPPPPTAMPPAKQMESAEQAAIRKEFVKNAPIILATMRQLNDAFVTSESPENRGLRLLDFYQKVHSLTGLAATAGFEQIAHLASAFEALLSELHQKPAFITPSTLQTIARTLEFLRLLLAQSPKPARFSLDACKCLVVDDDTVSAHALVSALRKAHLVAIGVQDPVQAFDMLQEEIYSLVLLDIEMPGLDGFELCERLRSLPQYARTPIIFVTGHTEFDNRIHSVLSGGNDLIGKPVFPIELAVKAMTHLLRSRLPDPWATV